MRSFANTSVGRLRLAWLFSGRRAKAFDYEPRVLVRSLAQMRGVVAGAPKGWPDPTRRCNVAFLKAPLTVARAMRAATPKDGVDALHPGKGVIYFDSVKSKLPQSGMNRIASTPEYKRMTIRTFGTVSQLLERMDAGKVRAKRSPGPKGIGTITR